jgi:ATP-binding cassette subfamily B multidrug efflux pump
LNRRYYKTTMLQVTMNSVLRPVMEVINSLAIALLILYGYNRISGGLLEIGVLYAFTTYVRQFFDPINDLAEKFNTIQSALVSADRIYELLDDPDPLEDLETGTHSGPVRGQVEFRHVWFAYEGEEWVLRDVSFEANIGEKIAFVGATGAGKTTIINLISRFYEPSRGEILVDGVPIKDWKLGELRRGVSVVLQDVVLFSGTIADNIRVNADMGDDEVLGALRQSMALDFVLEQPGQLYADVSERGATFSTGERQLLSFARAIAHNPAILVLDEATANIDTATELRIQGSIEQISQDRTTIFIAHRLSTIRSCHRIYVMHRGCILECGSHERLMEEGGAYRRLYEAQFDERVSI